MTPALELDAVTCTFASRDAPSAPYTAVRDVSLTVADGEFVSVVGPTGCGKSTLLNVAAGLLTPSAGAVRAFGHPLQGINRRAGYMFQSESLMPWRTARSNVMAGLQFRGIAADAAREQADHDHGRRPDQRHADEQARTGGETGHAHQPEHHRKARREDRGRSATGWEHREIRVVVRESLGELVVRAAVETERRVTAPQHRVRQPHPECNERDERHARGERGRSPSHWPER